MKFKKEHLLGKSDVEFETIIGGSLTLKGDLEISKPIRVDGTVIGNICQTENQTATIVISDTAIVTGDIRAQHIIISGKITGNIFAEERLELLSKAHVNGNLQYGTIGIAVGATINGNLNQVSPSTEKKIKLIAHEKTG